MQVEMSRPAPEQRSFESVHCFQLSDGRRFASLQCAANSAAQMNLFATVTDEKTGRIWNWRDCLLIANGKVRIN